MWRLALIIPFISVLSFIATILHGGDDDVDPRPPQFRPKK